MGYDICYRGELTIRPDVPYSAWPYEFSDDGEGLFLLKRVDGEQDVQLVDGKIKVVGTPGHLRATLRYDEPQRIDIMDHDVPELIAFAKANGAFVNGTIEIDGEDSRDIRRIRVLHNEAADERPLLLWPDGSQEPCQ